MVKSIAWTQNYKDPLLALSSTLIGWKKIDQPIRMLKHAIFFIGSRPENLLIFLAGNAKEIIQVAKYQVAGICFNCFRHPEKLILLRPLKNHARGRPLQDLSVFIRKMFWLRLQTEDAAEWRTQSHSQTLSSWCFFMSRTRKNCLSQFLHWKI